MFGGNLEVAVAQGQNEIARAASKELFCVNLCQISRNSLAGVHYQAVLRYSVLPGKFRG
jgi:hypothetical protein